MDFCGAFWRVRFLLKFDFIPNIFCFSTKKNFKYSALPCCTIYQPPCICNSRCCWFSVLKMIDEYLFYHKQSKILLPWPCQSIDLILVWNDALSFFFIIKQLLTLFRIINSLVFMVDFKLGGWHFAYENTNARYDHHVSWISL